MLLLVVLVVGCFAACGKKEEAPETTTKGAETTTKGEEKDTEPAEEQKTYKVAAMCTLSDMYSAWTGYAMEAKAEEINAKVGYEKYKVDKFDFEDDETKWMTTAEDIASRGYDYVVSKTPPMDAAPAIQAIKDAGGKFVHISTSGYDYMLEQNLCRVIVCNEYGLGRVVAELAAEKLPENAKVCVLLGPADRQSSKDRYQAIQDVLAEKRPDVEILDAQVANWHKDEAMNICDDWQQIYDQIDGFLSVNDAMATGAVESLISNGFTDWDHMFICGVDGLTDACKAIIEGHMSCSANQDANKYADMFFEMIEKDIAGEEDMNQSAKYEFDPVLIDASNAQAQLDYYKEAGLLK